MFENLTEKLQRAFKNLRGQGKLTDEHLDAALAEIREALLEGDVNVGVADELLANIRKQAIGSEIMLQLSPDQQVLKVVRDELTALLGKHAKPLFASRPPPHRCFHGRLPPCRARTVAESSQSDWHGDLARCRHRQAARNRQRRHQ